MNVFLYVALGVTTAGVLFGLWCFDKLIDFEFARHHQEWVADGMPNGGRRSAAHASFWKSGFGRQHVFEKWLLSTPAWARGDGEAERLLRGFRLGAVVVLLGVSTFGAVVILGT